MYALVLKQLLTITKHTFNISIDYFLHFPHEFLAVIFSLVRCGKALCWYQEKRGTDLYAVCRAICSGALHGVRSTICPDHRQSCVHKYRISSNKRPPSIKRPPLIVRMFGISPSPLMKHPPPVRNYADITWVYSESPHCPFILELHFLDKGLVSPLSTRTQWLLPSKI